MKPATVITPVVVVKAVATFTGGAVLGAVLAACVLGVLAVRAVRQLVEVMEA